MWIFFENDKVIINTSDIVSMYPDNYDGTPHDFLRIELREHPPIRIYFEDWRDMEDAVARIANAMRAESGYIRI